ncbi:MAG: 50S ribosomal protein L18 [Planctomycetota bacterium]|jgi:large subunit ribosomal protein L18
MVNHIRRLARRKTRRTYRVRNAIRSNSTRQHRLTVFRSNSNIYAQVIDDEQGRTVCSANSLQKGLVEGSGGNVEAAKAVGRKVAELALAEGINAVTLDRGSYRYHGRVAALADAVREAGVEC